MPWGLWIFVLSQSYVSKQDCYDAVCPIDSQAPLKDPMEDTADYSS